ncbi:MAG: hypothetical protein SOW44_01850 [Porphyromonas sp.]|nr:hypothetical protein [Bacteroidales bacterium]MDY3100073.1 hypothetical protein [Porphyromonas sp.]
MAFRPDRGRVAQRATISVAPHEDRRAVDVWGTGGANESLQPQRG